MAASFTPKPLLRGAVPTTAPVIGSPAYTTPANTATQIRSIDFTNTTGATITASVWIVPSGSGSVTSAMLYLSSVLILPGLPPDSDQRTAVLSAGDMIFWQASATGCNGYVSGAEEVLS